MWVVEEKEKEEEEEEEEKKKKDGSVSPGLGCHPAAAAGTGKHVTA